MRMSVVVAGAMGLRVVTAAATISSWWAFRNDGGTSAAADAVRIPSGWTLSETRVSRGQLFCFDGPRCPSLQRNYVGDSPLRWTQLQQALDSSDAGFSKLRCSQPSATVSSCSASAILEGVRLTVSYAAPDTGSPAGSFSVIASPVPIARGTGR
ncbi:hypothetical protein [Curtobacterium sp. VKM Ac-2922]|uniref:hypothetical protein n=1 Tax=Curtobacterium sp. VKM Ac-2922 TaxID=2929475 RepID=UPI001FB4FA8A|nr:hypothetical protein [Curtobacterium sp. VKM Ac-2922]MCJ1715107.1 hypothetical protein [Curtobacterium sp. VKM Ac-2922]